MACRNGHSDEYRVGNRCTACRREQSRLSQAKRRAADPDAARRRSRESSAKWRAAHPEAKRAADRGYYSSHREQVIARTSEYKRHNPEQHLMHARRAAAKVRAKLCPKRPEAVPPWADLEAIHFFYECCPEGCHVDHVIPLRGKLVSGLHVAENLQWLPAAMNLSKHSKFEPYTERLGG